MLFFQNCETLTVVSSCGWLESVKFSTILPVLGPHSQLSPCESIEDPIMQPETQNVAGGPRTKGLSLVQEVRRPYGIPGLPILAAMVIGSSRSSTFSEVTYSRTGHAVMLK